MSQPSWQRLVLSLTVGGGVLCVLVAVYLFTRLAPQAFIGAADLLPANETVLVIGDADSESLQSWRAWLPMPTTFPTQTGAVMALLDLNDSRVWVTLIPEPGSDPPFAVTTSTPEAKAMIGYGNNRLGDAGIFVRLKPKPNSGSWAWWSTELLGNLPAIPLSIHQAIAAGVVTRDTNRTSISVLPRTMVRIQQTALPDIAGDLTISMVDPQTTIDALDRLLPQDATLPAYGLLRERLKAIVGTSVSPGFDILPLLEGPASLTVTRTGSGTAWTLHGTNDDDLSSRLSDIYGRARSNGVGITVDRRQIEGFEINEVREGNATMNEETINANGWNGWLREEGGQVFCAAMRGPEFLLANTRDACAGVMEGSAAEEAALRGSIDAALLRELRDLQLPGIVGAMLQTMPDRGMQWIVDEQNGVIRVWTQAL